MHLHQHPFRIRTTIAHFGDTVARAANFEEDLALYGRRSRCNCERGLLHVTGRTPRQVRLVLLALRVSEVGALIGVEG